MLFRRSLVSLSAAIIFALDPKHHLAACMFFSLCLAERGLEEFEEKKLEEEEEERRTRRVQTEK